MENFPSQFVSPRNIDIWLPEDYSPRKNIALFTCTTAKYFSTPLKPGIKRVERNEVFSELLDEKKIKPCIVVAIWNTLERITEYFPNKIFDRLDTELQKIISEK